MLKKLIILIGLAVSAALVTSCFDDNTITYDGPLQMEVKPGTLSINNIQNNNDDRQIIVSVQLIGPLQTESHSGTLNFIADDSVGLDRDAEDDEDPFLYNLEPGVHFEVDGCDFVNNSACDFTITPEDSLSVDFNLRFLLRDDDGANTILTRSQNTVVFELSEASGSDSYRVAPNLMRSEITALRGNN